MQNSQFEGSSKHVANGQQIQQEKPTNISKKRNLTKLNDLKPLKENKTEIMLKEPNSKNKKLKLSDSKPTKFRNPFEVINSQSDVNQHRSLQKGFSIKSLQLENEKQKKSSTKPKQPRRFENLKRISEMSSVIQQEKLFFTKDDESISHIPKRQQSPFGKMFASDIQNVQKEIELPDINELENEARLADKIKESDRFVFKIEHLKFENQNSPFLLALTPIGSKMRPTDITNIDSVCQMSECKSLFQEFEVIINPNLPKIQEEDLMSDSKNLAENIEIEAPESEGPSKLDFELPDMSINQSQNPLDQGFVHPDQSMNMSIMSEAPLISNTTTQTSIQTALRNLTIDQQNDSAQLIQNFSITELIQREDQNLLRRSNE